MKLVMMRSHPLVEKYLFLYFSEDKEYRYCEELQSHAKTNNFDDTRSGVTIRCADPAYNGSSDAPGWPYFALLRFDRRVASPNGHCTSRRDLIQISIRRRVD